MTGVHQFIMSAHPTEWIRLAFLSGSMQLEKSIGTKVVFKTARVEECRNSGSPTAYSISLTSACSSISALYPLHYISSLPSPLGLLPTLSSRFSSKPFLYVWPLPSPLCLPSILYVCPLPSRLHLLPNPSSISTPYPCTYPLLSAPSTGLCQDYRPLSLFFHLL